MSIIIVLFLMIVIFCLLGIVSAVLEAYLEVKNRPKEEMFKCPLGHGIFRKKHCLVLFPDLGGTAQNSFICPICYKEKVFDNPDRKLYG
jgi:hypothetical protein